MSYGNNRPKFWVLPTIAFLIIFGLGFAVDKAHSVPNQEPCATPSEWKRLEIGMSRAQVYHLLDGRGSKGESSKLRQWNICGKLKGTVFDNGSKITYAKMIVQFKDGKAWQGYWIVAKLHPAPDNYIPDGFVPCDNPPPALPYCDPTLPPDEVVCYNADNQEVECNFRQSLK